MSQCDLYVKLFGKWNDFTRWLYDLLMYHSMKFIVKYDRMNNISDIELVDSYNDDLLSMDYDKVYNKFDYKLYVPEDVDKLSNIKNNKIIYRYPLIKALYYSYKYRNRSV